MQILAMGVPDLSFTLTFPIFTWAGINLWALALTVFMLWWIVKMIISTIMGG